MTTGLKSAEEIGARVGELRRRAGLTVAELASALGVTEDAVQRIQRGESAGQFLKLIRLANALGATPNEILGFNSFRLDVLRAALNECFGGLGLPDDEAAALAQIVEQVIEAPPTRAEVDRPTQARIESSFAVREFLRTRRAV